MVARPARRCSIRIDEPFGALDLKVRKDLRRKLLK
jgi:ABC-type sulfate/molybdate transport systems ATPase subunit